MWKNDEVPAEVTDYLRARERLEAFKARHPELWEELSTLTEEYNAARDGADRVVRDRNIEAPGFQKISVTTAYDADALYESLGPEEFLRVGGTSESVRKFSVDKKRIEAAIATGQIDEKTVARVRKITPRYHTPKKLELP